MTKKDYMRPEMEIISLSAAEPVLNAASNDGYPIEDFDPGF